MTRALLFALVMIVSPAFAQDDAGAKEAETWQTCVEEHVEDAQTLQTDMTSLTEQAFAACQGQETAYKGVRPLATQESDRILMRESIAAAVAAKFATPAPDGITQIKKDD